MFKHYSTHIKKYDWLKFYSLIIIILLTTIVVSGKLSHFGVINRAKKVCYARLEVKECDVMTGEHEYYIPGKTAKIFDFPYKLGVTYTCRCDNNTKTIMMNTIKKIETETKTEEKEEKEESLINNLIIWLTSTSNSTV